MDHLDEILRNRFLRCFRKRFPRYAKNATSLNPKDLRDCVTYITSLRHEVLGGLLFRFEHQEITLYTDINHAHFSVQLQDETLPTDTRVWYTVEAAINWFQDLIHDKILVIAQKSKGKIVSVTSTRIFDTNHLQSMVQRNLVYAENEKTNTVNFYLWSGEILNHAIEDWIRKLPNGQCQN